jgi:hypothetical protein
VIDGQAMRPMKRRRRRHCRQDGMGGRLGVDL